jgi:hypothetical protein
MDSASEFGFTSGGGGSLPPSTIIQVVQGGTGATTPSGARANLGSASSGANTDITSVALTSGTITDSPTTSTSIVNRAYVDSLTGGLNWHQSCRYATTSAFGLISMTYSNGSSGVNATLTNNLPYSPLFIDGNYPAPTTRILVKDASNSAWNGVYVVMDSGSGSTAWVLKRATDYDQTGSGVDEIDAGDYILVVSGTSNSNTAWVQQTPLPITIGTTPIIFIQFGATPTYPISIANGGTGATDVVTARSNLGLGSISTQDASNVYITGGYISGITDLAVADGGTGASNPNDARLNLGLVIGTNVLAPNGDASALTNFPTLNQNTTGTASNVTGVVAVLNGGTGATDVSTARTNLGLGSMAVQNSSSVSISGGTITGITDLAVADGGTGASTSSGARTNLGLGTISTQDANNVSITGGSVTGITDLAVADGGTGASTSSGARTNLGLVIGTDVLAPNGDASLLTNFPTLNQNTTGTASNVTGVVAVANGGTGSSTQSGARTNLGLVIGTDVLAPNGNASALTNFPTFNQNTTGTASNVTGVVAVANGGTGASDSATARTNLGLGSIATQSASSVSITGGSISGITDLAVADGGTGASTSSGARTNLGLVIGTDVLAPNGDASALTNFPTLNQNTTGTASNVTGVVAVANGGTGASDSATARTNLGLVIGTNVLAPNGDASALTNFPTFNQNTTGTASNVTGVVAVANGGTGASTSSGARTNLGLVIGTDVLAPNGSASLLTSFPTLNQNTTGTASNVTGIVAVANGGTGISTTPSNGAIPIGNGTNYTSATITAGSGISVTNSAGGISIAQSGILATAGGLTGITSIPATLTYTSGGITLLTQTMASGSVWRIRAIGNYVATASATARNGLMACFWGSTQLTSISQTIVTNQTTGWNLEFILTGSSTTAVWTTGQLVSRMSSTTAVAITNTTPASTSVTAGSQTLDLRFAQSVVVAGDSWAIHSVTMERLK